MVAGGLPAQGTQSWSLMQEIQRERQAATALLQGEGETLAMDDDILSYLGVGRAPGFEQFDLQTLHLLDVLGAYFPYCKAAMTEATVSELTAQHSVPSIDQYIELLPKRSGFEFDLHVYNKVSETPALLMVLDIISSSPPHFKRCWQHVKSLLATTIGLWHCAKESKLEKKHAPQLLLTRKVLQVMARAGWLQDPWSKVSEIVHELTPAELVKLLMAVWDTLIKFPPQVEHSPSTLRSEFGRLKPLFVDNIVALAP